MITVSLLDDLVVPDVDPALTALYEGDLPVVVPVPGHTPVHIADMGNLALTVIRVDDARGRTAYQVYAVESGSWSLVGYFGLLVDALARSKRGARTSPAVVRSSYGGGTTSKVSCLTARR